LIAAVKFCDKEGGEGIKERRTIVRNTRRLKWSLLLLVLSEESLSESLSESWTAFLHHAVLPYCEAGEDVFIERSMLEMLMERRR